MKIEKEKLIELIRNNSDGTWYKNDELMADEVNVEELAIDIKDYIEKLFITPNITQKNTILVIFTKKNKKELFRDLKSFYIKYPIYKQWEDQIKYSLFKKKQPFDHYDCTIYRGNVILNN